MKKKALINKITVFLAAPLCALAILNMPSPSQCSEDKEELANYIEAVSPIMTDADMTVKNVGFNIVTMNEGARCMADCIEKISQITPPEVLSGQYKMTVLAFKKIRMGLLLFSLERKTESVGLIKNGGRLLKYSANNILDILKKEELFKKQAETNQKGE